MLPADHDESWRGAEPESKRSRYGSRLCAAHRTNALARNDFDARLVRDDNFA